MRKTLGILTVCIFCLGSQSFSKEYEGRLRRVDSSPAREFSYECSIQTISKEIKLQVSINPETRFMRSDLGEGIRVNGYASETIDEKTGTTHYFLQGGSAPYAQQLTLLVRNGGNWAQFKKTYGGTEFSCK